MPQRTGGGSIVNVAAIRSIVAGGNMVQCDTTKAAVAGLTRAMARDHAADGIRVNAVHERRAAAAGRTAEEPVREGGLVPFDHVV
jgi:NAD(P)-dependent dehydrogenase (short-subunit alcohol dehydrogenase family)